MVAEKEAIYGDDFIVADELHDHFLQEQISLQ